MMISILVSTKWEERVKNSIASEQRLNELVKVEPSGNAVDLKNGFTIEVSDQGISVCPDWFNLMPPILFPDNILFNPDILMGIIFCELGNFEKAYQYLANYVEILQPVDIINRLQNNISMEDAFTNSFTEEFVHLHNLAIAYQYGAWEQEKDIASIISVFTKTYKATTTAERKAFSCKHFVSFLTDINEFEQAAQLAEEMLQQTAISSQAIIELKVVQCNSWMKQLTVPYNETMIEKLKTTLWECLQQYESQGRNAEAALLLIDASQVANISNSFTESLGYINKAIELLRAENLTELVGSAQLRKGMLLYTWAQNGQPQFYRTALQALQNALTVFGREEAPDVFADIHHHLGVIYSEIQDEVKKRGVWAAVSVSSFTEALNFYNKVDYPYDFAMICHHFGNAYTKYPAALHSDNYDKALAWYREALDIRTSDSFPIERCNTLYNYLEASWLTGNPNETFNAERFNDMWEKANELLLLTTDNTLKAEASGHLDQLIQLKANFNNTTITTEANSTGN